MILAGQPSVGFFCHADDDYANDLEKRICTLYAQDDDVIKYKSEQKAK